MLTDHAPYHAPTVRPSRRSAGLPIHVLLVDDHPAVREGVRHLLAAQPDLVTIAESDSASADTVERARWAEVAVIDYQLPGHDGLWLTYQIKQRPGAPRVLIYSAFADRMLGIAAVVADADGLLDKGALDEELCVCIRMLADGRRQLPVVPPWLAAAVASSLEPRDREVLSLLLHGIPPGEIASRLGTTQSELSARRLMLLRKLTARGHSN